MNLHPNMPPLPKRIAKLPVDERGFPVPWFVAWVEGKPDFRVIGPGKREEAYRQELCWVCGQKLGAYKAFLIGPMCAVNRVSAEPPSHVDCAEFSAKACPFLSNPDMRRNEHTPRPEGYREADGIGIARNPGVTLLWGIVGHYKPFPDGQGGFLFDVGTPVAVRWFCRGRPATRAEVMASIDSGLPILKEMAEKDGLAAMEQLGRQVQEALKLVPEDLP